MISGIYKIQSKSHPERIYIGSAIDIKKRWRSHRNELDTNHHKNDKLQKHYNKYGKGDLLFIHLLGCEKEDLIKNEQYFLDSFPVYFNICKVAGNTLGVHPSNETRGKMSKTHKSINTWSKNSKRTPEQCKNIGASRKGKSSGMKGKVAWNKGRQWSEKEKDIYFRKSLSELHKQHIKESWILRRLKMN